MTMKKTKFLTVFFLVCVNISKNMLNFSSFRSFALICFLVSSIANSSYSQNYWQAMLPDYCIPREIFKNDSILHVFVRNANTGEPWYYKYNINGSYIDSKKLHDFNFDYIIKEINDTSYIFAGSYVFDSISYRKLIYFDNNLNPIWIRTDSTHLPISSSIITLAVLNDKIAYNYVLINWDTYPYGSSTRYCLLNNQGILLNDTICNINGYLFSYINNKLLFIAPNSYTSKTKLTISDLFLNIIDSTTINSFLSVYSGSGYNNVLIDYNNGEIISYSNGLFFLNSSLDSIKFKPISQIYNSTTVSFPHDIKFTQNGGLALAGSYHYDYHDMGYLFNLNSNLNVINNNIYYYFPAEWVHRIIPTNDGTFILLLSAENLTGRTWIVRTNIDGSLPVEELTKPMKLQVFPNPAQYEVNVSFNEFQSGKITLTDLSGCIVWQSEFFNSERITIPIEYLSSGIYILTVYSQNEVFTSKICKY